MRWRRHCYWSIDIAGDYAESLPDEGVRATIFPMIEQELELTREMVLKVSAGSEIAERFPEYRRSLLTRLPTINEVNREQVELLRRFRGAPPRRTRGLQIRTSIVDQHRCRRRPQAKQEE